MQSAVHYPVYALWREYLMERKKRAAFNMGFTVFTPVHEVLKSRVIVTLGHPHCGLDFSQ